MYQKWYLQSLKKDDMQPVPNGSDRGSYPGGTCSDHQYRVVSPDSVVAKSMIDYGYSSDNLVTDTDGSDT